MAIAAASTRTAVFGHVNGSHDVELVAEDPDRIAVIHEFVRDAGVVMAIGIPLGMQAMEVSSSASHAAIEAVAASVNGGRRVECTPWSGRLQSLKIPRFSAAASTRSDSVSTKLSAQPTATSCHTGSASVETPLLSRPEARDC